MLYIKTSESEYTIDDAQTVGEVSDGVLNDIAAMEFSGASIDEFAIMLSDVYRKFGGRISDDVTIDEFHRVCETVAAEYLDDDDDDDDDDDE